MFHIKSQSDYQEQYQASIANPTKFWSNIADNFSWFKKWQETMNCNLEQGQIEWYSGAKTNLAYNCLDNNLKNLGDKIAIIAEPNDESQEVRKLTYNQLHSQVCQFANLLLSYGIKKGDRVAIYMPMIPESAIAMLACARIGAVHSVVFAGFSANSLSGRIKDCGAKMLITADLLYRGAKTLNLLEIAKESLINDNVVETVLCYKRAQDNINLQENWQLGAKLAIWQEEIAKLSNKNEAVILDAQDPAFILYTSGSTGKPKGILHAVAGYMVYAGYSFKNVFQYQEGDIHFCTADVGWITGHSYLVYGPLLNGATVLMFEGVPTYPDASRFWKIIEKHKVNIFYTAPTAIRALMQKGDDFVQGHDLSSLKTLGTVGEPINEEAWNWYFTKIGKEKCPIVDTWWQTETGGILISSLSGVTKSKAAYAGMPLPGIVPILFDDLGNEVKENNKIANLCFKQPWPGMARGVWGDRDKFITTYYQKFKGYYLAGDSAFYDENNLYRIIGRNDDVIKVSGHRLGTAEIENAINSCENIVESAVIAVPHEITGEAIYAFAIFKEKPDNEDILKEQITQIIKKEIGAIAKPQKIYLVNDLPKTRSGKIMRRILKKMILGQKDLGDISTLVNPEVINLINI